LDVKKRYSEEQIVDMAQRYRRYRAPMIYLKLRQAGHRVNHKREECLNEHWFVSLNHARVVIRAWVREYNEERPKKALGGLAPTQYAKQLAEKAVTFEPGL
jgi:transposase InsO family protein